MKDLTAYERDLLDYLRKQANSVKDCFTNFSFQALGVGAVAMGLIAKFQPSFPLLGLASLSVILLALSVARIGTYKYSTANRIHGYELYLERVRHIHDSEGWKDSYREIGWEEAVRAWRTVQPTVFRLYYEFGRHKPNMVKARFDNLEYRWFEPERLHVQDATYHAGSYLRTMLSILYMLVALGLVSMASMCVQIGISGDYILLLLALPSTIAAGLFSWLKGRQLSQRRKLLEGGILCIHSCAIAWQLVVVAHHRAVTKLEGYSEGMVKSFQGYTHSLSEQAIQLRANLDQGGSPHAWIHDPVITN